MRLGERERVEERASFYYVKGRRESERERKSFTNQNGGKAYFIDGKINNISDLC